MGFAIECKTEQEDEMINIGTEIGGYKVTAAANGFALAVSETAPNPFVVWTVDDDGEGVCVGHYFNEREEAEWDFCTRAFEWFEDNVNITITEDYHVRGYGASERLP